MDFFTFHEQVNKRAAPERGAGAARDVMTVGQLTGRIDKALRDGLPQTVAVKGEISNLKPHHQSGHIYFTLKDPAACIDCVIYKSDGVRLKFTPDDGLEVVATGNVKVYAQRGRYQLYVTRLEPIGQGALELAFRQLCTRLEKEGLFEPGRKKPIPAYPQRIVLVTSTQTAAIQDMLKVLRRFPWLSIRAFHVPVQGDGSAEKIADALNMLNRCANQLGGIDLILLGRGGGSLEDLWEFNEECVARAICNSRIPIITGIGHEVDVSIADLVADYHAHTPTEAAQVATANWRNAREQLEVMQLDLRRYMTLVLSQARERLAYIERHELFRRPLDRINHLRQVLDDRHRAIALAMAGRMRRVQAAMHQLTARLEQHHPLGRIMRKRAALQEMHRRLNRGLEGRLRQSRARLSFMLVALGERNPRHAVRLHRQRIDSLRGQLDRIGTSRLTRQRERLESLRRHLEAIGPEQVLRRGYTITTLKKGAGVVKSSSQLKLGDKIVTRFADGKVESTVADSRQMSLFE